MSKGREAPKKGTRSGTTAFSDLLRFVGFTGFVYSSSLLSPVIQTIIHGFGKLVDREGL